MTLTTGAVSGSGTEQKQFVRSEELYKEAKATQPVIRIGGSHIPRRFHCNLLFCNVIKHVKFHATRPALKHVTFKKHYIQSA